MLRIMEAEGSSTHLQTSALCSHTEPEQSSPCPDPSLKSILILSFHLILSLPSGFLPSTLDTTTLYVLIMFSIRATYPAHNIILDLINRIIFGKEYSSYTNNHYNTLTIPWYQIPANQPNEWPWTVIRFKLRKYQPHFTALHTIITQILNINYIFPASPSRSCDRLFSNSLLHENYTVYTFPFTPTTNAMDKVIF